MTGNSGMYGGHGAAYGQSDIEHFRSGPLAHFLTDDVLSIDKSISELPPDEYSTIVSAHLLQDISDYRAALRSWFSAVRIGGHLLIAVPNALLCERQFALPVANRPQQRRLYTPRTLLDEIEEALEPNSYRVRLMADDDRGYDYFSLNGPRSGRSDILIALEKIEQPAWAIELGTAGRGAGPDYAFDPPRTRIETVRTRARHRILILKLDHLGDFVISIAALKRARSLFPNSHITLVVGSWNLDLARSVQVADEVIAFDAFPRNSSEEEVDVPGKRALLETVLPERYDLAIDLRTDTDTRTLLGRVNSALKAGLGTKADFPFLDIAFPIDLDRTHREAAREFKLDHHTFASQDSVSRLQHRALFSAHDVDHGRAIIWGPYWRLRPGRYVFEPFLEIVPSTEGLLMLDVALDMQRAARRYISAGDPLRIEFDVEKPDTVFEFRIWSIEEVPPLSFSFFGGKLIREGVPGELHQSDYLELLIELVARRVDQKGLLTDIALS